MNGWLIGIALVLGYLGLQNFGHMCRWKALVKSISTMSDLMGEMIDAPKVELEKAKTVWEEARIRAAQQVTGAAVMLLVIVIFLVALAVHGSI